MVSVLRPRLGYLEQAVMDHLWAAPAERWCTVREVHEALTHQRDIAYTTVLTVLGRLTEKRMVLQAREGRAYLYRATASQAELTAELLRDALDRVGDDDRQGALRHFVEKAPSSDLATLRRAISSRAAR